MLAVALTLAGTGCRFVSTPVGRIVSQPSRFQGSDVTIAGRVEAPRWMPGVGAMGFRVVEGKDSLLVLTLTDPPPSGTQVRLMGRFLRSYPVNGENRMVLFYRTGPDDERVSGTVDAR
jgi:hypothetical protein